MGGVEPAGYFYPAVPWVLDREVDVRRMLSDLGRAADEETLVIIDRAADIWGHRFEVYAHQIIEALTWDFVEINPTTYVSRATRIGGQLHSQRTGMRAEAIPTTPTGINQMAASGGAWES